MTRARFRPEISYNFRDVIGIRVGEIKVIHKDVKPFLNETVKKICFHVDL